MTTADRDREEEERCPQCGEWCPLVGGLCRDCNVAMLDDAEVPR